MKLVTTLVIAALSLAGCAGQTQMRTVAGQSATILTTYRNSIRDFASRQTVLNTSNEQRLDQLRSETADREGEIANNRDGWDLAGNKEALRRLGAVSKVKADDVLADMAPRLPTPPPPSLTYDSSGTDAVLKQLVNLGRPITLEQQLSDLVAYGTKLRERYQANLKEANDDATKAQGDASGAALQLVVAAEVPRKSPDGGGH